MCSRYIAERSIISLMARELTRMQSLERKGLAYLLLVTAGFNKRDARKHLDEALASERARRLAMAGIVPLSERRVS